MMKTIYKVLAVSLLLGSNGAMARPAIQVGHPKMTENENLGYCATLATDANDMVTARILGQLVMDTTNPTARVEIGQGAGYAQATYDLKGERYEVKMYDKYNCSVFARKLQEDRS